MKLYIMRSWRDLCEEAEAEADPRKSQKLAAQITDILRGKLAHLKACQARAERIRWTTRSCPINIRLLLWQRPPNENRRPNQKTVDLCTLPGVRCCRRVPLSIAGRWSTHRTAHGQEAHCSGDD
jgi:hypothetical protein